MTKAEASKKYREENKERIAAYKKEYAATHNDALLAKARERHAARVSEDPNYAAKKLEASKKFRENNKELRREQATEYRENHRDELRKRYQEFRDAHKDDPGYHEKRREYLRAFRERHKEDINAARREYYGGNKEKELARTAEYRSGGIGKEKFKIYHRVHHLRKSYGITIEEFEEMKAAQDNKCAICKKEFTFINYEDYQKSDCYIDHDHETGKIRKLLCHNCNCALGQMSDSPELLRKAADYIVGWKHKHEQAGAESILPEHPSIIMVKEGGF